MTNVVKIDSSDQASSAPHSAEVEGALLGALLTNNTAWEKVSDLLLPEHFYEPAHGRIYEAVGVLINDGSEASPLSLGRFFDGDEGLDAVGGGQYIYDLAANVVSVVQAPDYARQILDMARSRRALEAMDMAAHSLRVPNYAMSTKEIIDTLQDSLDRIGEESQTGGPAPLSVATKEASAEAIAAFNHTGAVTGLTTGLTDLNRKTGGLHPSDLIILAGRPSMGKTALAMTIAYHAAVAEAAGDNRAVLYFSLEMPRRSLALRLQSTMSAVSVSAIRRGQANQGELDAFVRAGEDLANLPIRIDDSSVLTVSSIRSRARRARRESGIALVVVDYLQLLTASTEARRHNNRVQEVSQITRDLKELARFLDCPVLALSQLSRAVEQRDDKRPNLADLRESGSIEQDADLVMLMYRDEYYLSKSEPKRTQSHFKDDAQFEAASNSWMEKMATARNVCEVIIDKHRQGPTGTVRLFFDGPTTRFEDLSGNRQGEML